MARLLRSEFIVAVLALHVPYHEYYLNLPPAVERVFFNKWSGAYGPLENGASGFQTRGAIYILRTRRYCCGGGFSFAFVALFWRAASATLTSDVDDASTDWT